MSKYIVTYRLDSKTSTYDKRLTAMKNFLKESSKDYVEDDTTSTIYCKGEKLATELKNSNILNSTDLVIFFRMDDKNQLQQILRLEDNKLHSAKTETLKLFVTK